MEGVSATMYKGLRGYWKRRGYKKLNGSDSRRRKIRVSELGSTRGRRRRVWRIRIGRPKLGFLRRVPSPKKLLVWLRDAYVKMMLGFANTRVCSTGYGGGLFNDRIGSFGRAPLKEYDNKMIIEIYKSLVLAQAQAQGQLVHREPPKLSSESVASR
ncbi:hypothetical protein CsatB_005937 [Cannabis sativa]|uniref:Uncharacterized protein n=1 Tax=Cannabis sativa TaxID=3483 RepID=A0A7J6GNA6_CANSA|nr:hypothetical protein G4B88_006602 [Cannabis sativa]KAF4383589.1 hypothetical protein F8388_014089 [Cannabis sativa]